MGVFLGVDLRSFRLASFIDTKEALLLHASLTLLLGPIRCEIDCGSTTRTMMIIRTFALLCGAFVVFVSILVRIAPASAKKEYADISHEVMLDALEQWELMDKSNEFLQDVEYMHLDKEDGVPCLRVKLLSGLGYTLPVPVADLESLDLVKEYALEKLERLRELAEREAQEEAEWNGVLEEEDPEEDEDPEITAFFKSLPEMAYYSDVPIPAYFHVRERAWMEFVFLGLNDTKHPKEVDHCQWEGVSCVNAVYQCGEDSCSSWDDTEIQASVPVVTRLDLPESELSGTLPTELGAIEFLSILYLSNNHLHGSIPTELAQLTELRYIFLNGNDLTGALPPLRIAREISVQDNFLTGGVTHQASPDLMLLDMSRNALVGSITAFEHLPHVQFILLGGNGLTGSLPDVSALTNLLALDLSDNVLTEFSDQADNTLPESLWDLNVAENKFGGPLPLSHLTHLQSLQTLQASGNQFTGPLLPSSDPPDIWESLSHKLSVLKLDRNLLTGSVPSELYTALASNLRLLDLSYNKLTGTIATELGLMTSLYSCSWEGNKLTGTLPDEMLKMDPNLRLNFTDNLLTGTIPKMFCGLGEASVNILYRDFGCDAVLCRPGTFNVHGHATLHSACRRCPELSGSRFLGQISCEGQGYVHGDLDGDGLLSPREILRMIYIDTLGRFWGEDFQPWSDMKNHPNECDLVGITCVNGQIARIDLSNAEMCSNGNKKNLGPGIIRFCEGLPTEIGELSGLEVLQLTRRQYLRGTIPTEIGKLTLLRLIDFSSCTSMTGTLPSEIANLTNLRRLVVSHSRFHGTIASGIFGLSSLEKVHLTNNAFTGSLASEIGNLKNAKEFMISRNNFTGRIPNEIGGMTKLENFEAYHNQFTDHIPSELGLPSIKRIDIFNNKLSGSLPQELANASLLQIFHAKDNLLTGTVPAGLGDLAFLTWLDISHNYLTGTIPDSFAKSTSIEDFRLGNNMLHSFPPGLCTNPKINGGATKVHGCNGVICPIGTKSDDGHATVDRPCSKCPYGKSSLYLGSSGCMEISDEVILHMLYEVMEGDSWKEENQLYWNDRYVSVCGWGGLFCDDGGELTSLSIPLMAACDI